MSPRRQLATRNVFFAVLGTLSAIVVAVALLVRYVAGHVGGGSQRLQSAAKRWSSQMNWDAIEYSERSPREDGELHEFIGFSPEVPFDGVDGATIRASRSFVHGQSSIGIEIQSSGEFERPR